MTSDKIYVEVGPKQSQNLMCLFSWSVFSTGGRSMAEMGNHDGELGTRRLLLIFARSSTRAAQKLVIIGKILKTSQIWLYQGWIKSEVIRLATPLYHWVFGELEFVVNVVDISNFGGGRSYLVVLTQLQELLTDTNNLHESMPRSSLDQA